MQLDHDDVLGLPVDRLSRENDTRDNHQKILTMQPAFLHLGTTCFITSSWTRAERKDASRISAKPPSKNLESFEQ